MKKLTLPRLLNAAGKVSSKHPLLVLLEKAEPGTHVALARHMDVRPQSLSKWRAQCRADRNFRLPALRAKQAAEFFGLSPSAFRPDLYPAGAK